jgi:hypothetical protein
MLKLTESDSSIWSYSKSVSSSPSRGVCRVERSSGPAAASPTLGLAAARFIGGGVQSFAPGVVRDRCRPRGAHCAREARPADQIRGLLRHGVEHSPSVSKPRSLHASTLATHRRGEHHLAVLSAASVTDSCSCSLAKHHRPDGPPDLFHQRRVFITAYDSAAPDGPSSLKSWDVSPDHRR